MKFLAITGMLVLLALSLAGQAYAQGAASGESVFAFRHGQAPAVPATRVPGLGSGRLSYWELAGLGREPLGTGAPPPAALGGGMAFNPFCIFGPYGLHGQYSIYGPYGMFGPAGPGYGSGLGFYGSGRSDPWSLVKIYNEGLAARAAAAAPAKAAPKDVADAGKSTNTTGQANVTAPTSAR